MSLRLFETHVRVYELPLSKDPEIISIFECINSNGLLFLLILVLPFRCFIPNIYAALSTAVLVPLICVVTVLVVFIHAYQVTQQWKAYDDVYRGRTNSSGLKHTTEQIRCSFLCIYRLYI